MITCQLERVQDLWAELRPLLAANWKETGHYPDIALDPDETAYEAMEAAGRLRCYTARLDGALVGYAAFLVCFSPHHRQSLQASHDVLFVLPEHRSKGVGIRLIRYCEKALAADKVQVVYHHAKCTTNVGELFERLGYDLIDKVYAKRLDAKE